MWTIQQVEINGGFLPGLTTPLPNGLTCIIGPRGSGKSTLAEALRFALKGTVGASRKRLDLLQANLGNAGLVTLGLTSDSGTVHTLRRSAKQQPSLVTQDGRAVTNVDLDRGTYLPIDAFNSEEIENIADEVLGKTRRALLDDLKGADLASIHLTLGEHRRALEANADQIRATRRTISDFGERIEEFGDVRAQLAAFEPLPETGAQGAYNGALKQQQQNIREAKTIDDMLNVVRTLKQDAEALKMRTMRSTGKPLFEEGSANSEFLKSKHVEFIQAMAIVEQHLANAVSALDGSIGTLEHVGSDLKEKHVQQTAKFTELQQQHQAADERYRLRLDLEQRVARLTETETAKRQHQESLNQLLESRGALKARFLSEREQVSNIRDSVAQELTAAAGEKIRVRVLRNADDLTYRNVLTQGIKGAGVRSHEDILNALMALRPEQLAQLIYTQDCDGLDDACGFGPERAKKILSALHASIDPLQLEIVEIDDVVKIELNVATAAEPLFKDAAELSRGQKCTALLPLLLARTQNPLIIDQPEDNLDNHFIYETVVNSIRSLKTKRQMIFITHNANIPVLGEADLVIVMNSDGKIGFIQKSGSVDECRDHIVDLLEGGREAFELRRQRYGGK
jgi:energy-coupling factor transporter ATP-binding protein EcfA2